MKLLVSIYRVFLISLFLLLFVRDDVEDLMTEKERLLTSQVLFPDVILWSAYCVALLNTKLE